MVTSFIATHCPGVFYLYMQNHASTVHCSWVISCCTSLSQIAVTLYDGYPHVLFLSDFHCRLALVAQSWRWHYSAKWSHSFRAKSINITIVSFTIICFHLWQFNSHFAVPVHQWRLFNGWKGVKIEHLVFIPFKVWPKLLENIFALAQHLNPLISQKSQVVWYGLSHFLIKNTL